MKYLIVLIVWPKCKVEEKDFKEIVKNWDDTHKNISSNTYIVYLCGNNHANFEGINASSPHSAVKIKTNLYDYQT